VSNIVYRATSALDGASEALVNEAVRKITASRSLTTILIAHRLSTLRTADRIILCVSALFLSRHAADLLPHSLEDGKVSEQGSFAELSREGTRFEQHVRSQLLGRTPIASEPSRAEA
jgi:ATP-binding cassette subfamily B (MDR/TAP) protein 10